jgi:hypothetical protein
MPCRPSCHAPAPDMFTGTVAGEAARMHDDEEE